MHGRIQSEQESRQGRIRKVSKNGIGVTNHGEDRIEAAYSVVFLLESACFFSSYAFFHSSATNPCLNDTYIFIIVSMECIYTYICSAMCFYQV